MSQVAEADVEETELSPSDQAEAEELAGFESVVNGTKLPKSESAPADHTPAIENKQEEKVEDKPLEDSSKAAPPAAPVISQEQFAHLAATATTVKELEAGLKKLRDDAFGRLGGLERMLKETSSVESSLEVNVEDADLAGVKQNVEFLADPLKQALNQILKKVKVKVPGAKGLDTAALEQKLNEEVDRRVKAASAENQSALQQAVQEAVLTVQHPDWIQICKDPKFGVYMEERDKAQPGLKNMFLSSKRADEIGGVIQQFKDHQKAEAAKEAPPAPKPKPKTKTQAEIRLEQLKQAVNPKANSSTPAPKGPATEEDAFEEVASKRKK